MINKFRLDKNSQPEKYEIFIEPDLENEKFTGNEYIKLSIEKPTNDHIENIKLLCSWGISFLTSFDMLLVSFLMT